jgi:ATP-dependent RNA helicase RhlE
MERTTFDRLGIIQPILTALQTEGYTHPTPIQEQAIPHLNQGRDLLGCAQTGTGKTAAFAIPILQRLDAKGVQQGRRPISCLILTPTRELAIQIGESFAAYGSNLKLRHAVIFGGVGQKPQTDALHKGIDILVATPGRLLDLMGQGFVDLKNLEIFVLDEADRMLDMGFIHDVKKIIAKLPQKRQTLFFSATMPAEIAKLANSILTDPVKVEVTPANSTVDAIDQKIFMVDRTDKNKLLVHLLADPKMKEALVFTRTKHGANKVAKVLLQSGITAEAIHGNKSQTARQAALKNFKEGKTRVLVATDIAARGIDIDGLSHVINFDLPNVPETYVHRIGRTGRAGASGRALSFCDHEEREYLRDIQRLIKREVPVETEHPFVLTGGPKKAAPEEPRERQQRGGRNGQARQQGDRPHRQGGQRSERRPATQGGTRRAESDRPTERRNDGRRNGSSSGRNGVGERQQRTDRPAQRQPRPQQAGARDQRTDRPKQEQRPHEQRPQQRNDRRPEHQPRGGQEKRAKNDEDKLLKELFDENNLKVPKKEKAPEKKGLLSRIFKRN